MKRTVMADESPLDIPQSDHNGVEQSHSLG